MVNAEPGQRGARRRVDASDLRIETAVGNRPRHEARRMARAHLDDPTRLELADERVGGGGIEAWKPVLVEPRPSPGFKDAPKVRRSILDDRKDRGKAGLGCRKKRPQRGVVPRLDAACIAVGDEEAEPLRAEDGRKPEPQPPPAGAHRRHTTGGGAGPLTSIRLRQAWASRARSKSRTTTIDRANGMRR